MIRKTQVVDGSTYVVAYEYTLADRLKAIDYPDGARVEYTRDTLGRISAVKVRPTSGGALTNVVSAVSYQPFGSAASYTFAAGSQSLTFGYDQNDWLIDVGGSVLNLHYCRDGMANITRLKTTSPACTGTPAEQYGYDAIYRLTQVQNGSSGVIESYTYNLTGDRTGKTQGGVTTPYGYSSPLTSHRLLSVGSDSRGYDNAGNLATGSSDGRTLTFDARNRYVAYSSGSSIAVYDYNGRGERVLKDVMHWIPVAPSHFVYDEAGMLLSGNDSGNLTPTDYVYADGRPIALVRSGTLYYVHSDQLGTPRAVTVAGSATPVWSWSTQGNPFGEQAPTGSLAMNLRFPGQYFDPESGLNYNYFRDYEGGTGRYVESDPIGLRAGPSTYAYSGSNALIFSDPEGLDTYQCHRPIGGMPEDPREGRVNHQYSCVIDEHGTQTCSSTTPSDFGGLLPPGRPTTPQDGDYYSPKACQQTSSSNPCMDKCFLEAWSKPRPRYSVVPGLGQQCFQYDNDVNRKCRKSCGLK